jgi:uncharacterized metal-binding protein
MASKENCMCTADTYTVLACSGGSNVGQMTNEAAKRLDMEKTAKFFCLAGVGGHIGGMIESVKGAEKVLVLDGCAVACAKKMMEAADLSDYEYLVVTDLGIEKVHAFDMPEDDIEKILKASRSVLSGEETEDADAKQVDGTSIGGGCCCGGGGSCSG